MLKHQKSLLLGVVILTGLLLMAGCGGVGGSVGDRLRRTEIEGMFNEFENAWESMDEERVLSFYHEDYELVSPSTGEVLTRTDVNWQ